VWYGPAFDVGDRQIGVHRRAQRRPVVADHIVPANVRYHQTGTKRLHHPVVGELELSYEVMELSADAGLRLAIFTAEPGSHSEEALNLLASWAATPDRPVDGARRP
jgi:MmyB-like transcription regulator ligand binding domain